MIVKGVSNKKSEVPREFLSFGPDTTSEGVLAISPGKHYAVYAIRKNNDDSGMWYFVYTDNNYLWWMPATAFKVVDDRRPKGWTDEVTPGNDTMSAFPSLHAWNIEEGIIDRDEGAEPTYLAEVHKDSTFPTKQEIDKLNFEFGRQKRINKYNEELEIAKKNGWERPEKPTDR